MGVLLIGMGLRQPYVDTHSFIQFSTYDGVTDTGRHRYPNRTQMRMIFHWTMAWRLDTYYLKKIIVSLLKYAMLRNAIRFKQNVSEQNIPQHHPPAAAARQLSAKATCRESVTWRILTSRPGRRLKLLASLLQNSSWKKIIMHVVGSSDKPHFNSISYYTPNDTWNLQTANTNSPVWERKHGNLKVYWYDDVTSDRGEQRIVKSM